MSCVQTCDVIIRDADRANTLDWGYPAAVPAAGKVTVYCTGDFAP